MYSDQLIFAAFLLILVLWAMVGTRLDRKRKGEPPRWMEQANGAIKPRELRRIRGYDPVVKSRLGYDVKTVDLGGLPRMGKVVPK